MKCAPRSNSCAASGRIKLSLQSKSATAPVQCRLGILPFWLFLLVAAPVFAQKGFYRILGVDANTQIFFDEVKLDDAAGQYYPGRYTLRVEREGHHAFIDRIAIYPDQLTEVRVRSLPARIRPRPSRRRQNARLVHRVGTLVVTSTQPGKTVLLDSVARGETPLVLENVPIGVREITIDSVSTMISLRVFETVRVRLQNGKIENVTDEELPEDQRALALEDLALFFTEKEQEATNCSNFFSRSGEKVFRLTREGMFLVCRMTFRLPKNELTKFPVRFRLYRGPEEIYTVEHELPIDPRTDRRVCYFHHEWWRPGEYVLTIDTIAGNRLGEVSFTLF